MTDSLQPIWLYLGTHDGLRRATLQGDSITFDATCVRGNVIRDLSIHPRDPAKVLIGCGLRGWGLHRTTDGGMEAEALGFEDRWVWGVTRDPTDPATIYVGTEPPMLYRSNDAGVTFEPLSGIESVESRPRWTFFHPPFEAGHIHAVAIHPSRPSVIVAGVEHGGVLRSVDGGMTWQETRAGTDAHRIAFDPIDPDRVLLAAGSGLFTSSDAGLTWRAHEQLAGYYLHTVTFAPTDPTKVLVYADRSSDPLHLSTDGGRTWNTVGEGLPASRPADPLRFHPLDPTTIIYAGDGDSDQSQLFHSRDLGRSWTALGDPTEKVWRLEVVPAEHTSV